MIKLNIKATNIKLDNLIRDYINDKIGNLDKFIEGIDSSAQAFIEVGIPSKHHKKGSEEFYAEINIELYGKGRTVIRAESRKWDLKFAIDDARDKLQIELNKFKGKQEVRFKRKARIAKNLMRFSPLTWYNWVKKKGKK